MTTLLADGLAEAARSVRTAVLPPDPLLLPFTKKSKSLRPIELSYDQSTLSSQQVASASALAVLFNPSSAAFSRLPTMGNAPSSSRSHAHSSSSPTPQSSSTSAGPVASSFASLTSRARARSKSSNVPLTAAQILASEPLIDGGHTLPLGLYQLAIWDFSRDVVRKLVQDRKMAPFYYGLEDWEEDWEEGEIVKGLREAAFAVDKKRQVLREAGEPTGEVDPSTSSTSSKGASAANAPARLKEGPVSDVERRQAEWFTSSAAECPLSVLLLFMTRSNPSFHQTDLQTDN